MTHCFISSNGNCICLSLVIAIRVNNIVNVAGRRKKESKTGVEGKRKYNFFLDVGQLSYVEGNILGR